MDWTAANNALSRRFEGNQSKLVKHTRMGRTTVSAFFNEKAIGESSFRKISLALGLNPDKISGVDNGLGKTITSTSPQIDEALLEQIREHCRKKILAQHSRMQLLSGKEVGVDQLYVDVWLLNRSPRTFQVSPNKLLETFDLRNDRLGLGDRIERDAGFKIANKNSKLIILGKPGSGKTTFLKHLAVDWCNYKFQLDKIVILVELRRVDSAGWDLVKVIGHELGLQNTSPKVDLLLDQGKLLLLMDGLDEVPTKESRRKVQDELEKVAKKYPKNHFILSCRTQVIRVINNGFTAVEVADFNLDQVKRFVRNWFIANGKSERDAIGKWKIVNDAIDNQPALKELTVTPVLLSLICLVLQDEGEIPTNRAWLYESGIRLLLSRWNDDKQIERWELGTKIYRDLDLEDKEALLTEIAARKFEPPTRFSNIQEEKNFVLFRQQEITEEICHRLGLSKRQEGLEVLRAIETQHGLLIERAGGLWSFSHLTFQEHFTVQWLIGLNHGQLAAKISNLHWQNVMRQLVTSQQPADRLLGLIKWAIDRSIAHEPDVQSFLDWLLQKEKSVQTESQASAVRAFYYYFFALDHSNTLTPSFAGDLDYTLDYNLGQDQDRDFGRYLADDFDLDRALSIALTFALNNEFDNAVAMALTRARAYDSELTTDLLQFREDLMASNIQSDPKNKLQENKLQENKKWIERFQKILIEHRNVGHNWHDSQHINHYYYANKFLISLMSIKGSISKDVREKIEDDLLLSWKELQRRHPEVYQT